MKNLTQSYEKHREFSEQCTEEEQAMHEGEKSKIMMRGPLSFGVPTNLLGQRVKVFWAKEKATVRIKKKQD